MQAVKPSCQEDCWGRVQCIASCCNPCAGCIEHGNKGVPLFLLLKHPSMQRLRCEVLETRDAGRMPANGVDEINKMQMATGR